MGAATVFACGGEPPPAKAPEGGAETVPAGASFSEETESKPAAPPAPAPPASSPASSDALEGEDELTRAERELAAADQELSGSDAETSAAEAERHDAAPGRGSAPAKPKSSAPQQQNPCATTCKAFASLVRARDSICRITGSDGERCTRATEIVERHTARSTSCGCSS